MLLLLGMRKEKQIRSVLIVTYGPVPTTEYQTIEGGGMRAWGLAQGLKANGIDATIAINAGFPQTLSEYDGIKLLNWNLDADFSALINSFDAVIISYCLGDPSVFVADNIADDVQLILDCYVPIYIEVSARESKNIDEEYVNYAADIARHNHVLKRGDYFLYANAAQEQLYKGVLSALGIINPRSYRDLRLIETPFGIHRKAAESKHNPYKKLGITKDDFVVLWFGGIYPWFRVQEYLDAIQELSKDKSIKFVFVGGKNPFNPNPDFSRQYDTATDFSSKHHLTNKKVFFVDWVDFDTRIDWFQHADIIVSLNQPGEENKYSWRTRVMDFVWGEAVTITNGGDPLSDELVQKNAAVKIDELSSSALVKAIQEVKDNPNLLSGMQENVRDVKNKYYWDVVTKDVSSLIKAGELPFLGESPLRKQLGDTEQPKQASELQPAKIGQLVRSPMRILKKIKQKGVMRSLKLAVSIVKAQAKRKVDPRGRQKQFVFISHPINNTGAPIVLLQIVEEYVKKYGPSRVRVIAPGIEPKQKAFLNKLGIKVEHALFGANFHFIRLQLALKPDDFVFMNTVAVYDTYRDFVLLWLKHGRLRHAHWFIHEDLAQIPVIYKGFLDKANLDKLSGFVIDKKLSLHFPSKRTASEYADLLGVDNLQSVKLRVDVDRKYKQQKKPIDFERIDFLISGTDSDGRKGQLLALAAFQHFIDTYYREHPEKYRAFTLHLVAVGRDDYISQQIRWIGDSMLAKNIKIYEPLPKDDALEITSRCNVVICCSLNETFGLYIAEGMLMGHVVLRNDVAGVDEQLEEGKNGYLIDHTDIKQFAATLEQLLNTKKVTDGQLADMSLRSQAIMKEYSEYTYIKQIER